MTQHAIAPLFPEHGWEESNNLLDTFFYQELTQAEYRRCHENESIMQSAQIIHENMLSRILKIQAQTNSHNVDTFAPELTLTDNICKTLNLQHKALPHDVTKRFHIKTEFDKYNFY